MTMANVACSSTSQPTSQHDHRSFMTATPLGTVHFVHRCTVVLGDEEETAWLPYCRRMPSRMEITTRGKKTVK
ncbi:hypothetical protein TYRP_002427 [Tyrophagus putrescentiae]|nr:hypothetical protein TYRP_002427 [Tyrophagus putrescentiae]